MVELDFTFKTGRAKTQFQAMRKRIQDLRPLWEKFLSYYKTDIIPASFKTQGRIMGGRWEALKPRYAAEKLERWGKKPILVASGDMFNAATGGNGWFDKVSATSVEFGINPSVIPYASKHQDGVGVTKRAWFYTDKGDLPKRAWVFLMDEAEKYVKGDL